MSGWRNRRGNSSYNQQANRLRDKLESRKEPEESDRPPPGLKGRELGMWYARNKKRVSSSEPKLLTGPDISLDNKRIQKIRDSIKLSQSTSNPPSSRFRNDLDRHNQSDFIELLKSSAASISQTLPPPTEADERFYDELLDKGFSEDYIKMLECRQKLPAYQHKEEIVDLIKNHQVTLIEGNTGCGKTTQVAQYILDDSIINKRGSVTKILCTQPRRIAATSIAGRVASERAEKLGISVGYQIRLEKVSPRTSASINFCTTGVLLKFMEVDPALSEWSHIIIDEIHERNSVTDVCLALIKEIVKLRKDLKVILMSATLNAESFSKYFNNCPMIHIEGLTFEVQDLFLENILEETEFDGFKKSKKEPVWMKFTGGNKRRVEEFQVVVGNYVNSIRSRFSQKTINNLMNPESENINVDFIEFLIHEISYKKPPGAILVILPGYTVISKLIEALQNSPRFPKSKFLILPLHSLLTGSDQSSIFNRPPDVVRKIIVSTPLAETSITIDDVVYVINAGKMRKPYFDFERNAKVLEDQWITKANETQRRGRAGRVQEGFCYHLYTRARSNSFQPFEEPEILRIRLEEVLLTVKVLCIKNVKTFMSTLIDIPRDEVIESSLNLLQRLGALTESEELTPLGLHLARLAIPPQIGKMLLLSSIFSCFDPISSIAASLSFKSPFYSVMGKEDLCNEAKRKFSKDSDQIAVANVMREWRKMRQDRRSFCYENFLSHSTLLMLDRMKTQFAETLTYSKFLSNNKDSNKFSNNIDVLRGVICGGLYPNVAYRMMKVSGHRRREIIKIGNKSVKLLPSSVNCDDYTVYDPGFLVYHELQKLTNSFFLMETTANVGPNAILMFGDRIAIEENYISVGDIVKFKCNKETAQLILELRERFNQLLEKKIEEPSPTDWDSDEGKVLKAIIELISEGSKSFENFRQDDFDDEFE